MSTIIMSLWNAFFVPQEYVLFGIGLIDTEIAEIGTKGILK